MQEFPPKKTLCSKIEAKKFECVVLVHDTYMITWSVLAKYCRECTMGNIALGGEGLIQHKMKQSGKFAILSCSGQA